MRSCGAAPALRTTAYWLMVDNPFYTFERGVLNMGRVDELRRELAAHADAGAAGEET